MKHTTDLFAITNLAEIVQCASQITGHEDPTFSLGKALKTKAEWNFVMGRISVLAWRSLDMT